MSSKRASLGACACALACLLILSLSSLLATPAFALSEGRVYEMVSPPYKGGYAANEIEAVSPNGERLAFESLGAFDGALSSQTVNQYVAQREAGGWRTVPATPPAAITPTQSEVDFSASLGSSLSFACPGENAGAAGYECGETQLYFHDLTFPDPTANWELAAVLHSREMTYEAGGGASSDLTHIVFHSGIPLVPEAAGTHSNMYELVNGGGAWNLELVGLNDAHEVIDPYCPVELGAGGGSGKKSVSKAIADEGQIVFFTTNENKAQMEKCGNIAPNPANPELLFARLDGQRTVQISEPIAADCTASSPCKNSLPARTEFVGANEDGTRVFFISSRPLTTEDVGEHSRLYMAELGCPTGGSEDCVPAERQVTGLVDVSRALMPGEAPEVKGAVAVVAQGAQVYFVAQGVLSGENVEGGAPVKGADNLYMYDGSHGGSLAYVADLCSGPEKSGDARDASCPTNLEEAATEGETLANVRNDTTLWLKPQFEAQTTPDGEFLLFSSYGQLTESDHNSAKDVYRYDARDGMLVRVSIGENGYDANGNDSRCLSSDTPSSVCEASIPLSKFSEGRIVSGLDSRAISEDGSRVVFTSAEPLSPNAVNGLVNAYEWHKEAGEAGEGHVSLISSGSSSEPVKDEVLISSSGRDVFFVTSQGLVPQDADGAYDVYDARIGGGFPSVADPPAPCEGDACQGPLTNPAPLLVPGSVSQEPVENIQVPKVSRAKTKPKAKHKSVRKKKRKPSHRQRKAVKASVGGGR